MTNGERFKDLFGLYATEVWAMPEKDFLEWLNTLTTAAEPVKHAYVIVDEDGNMECSNCGSSNCFDNYCGTCGAKLIETRKENEE